MLIDHREEIRKLTFWALALGRFWISLGWPIHISIHQTHYEKSDWSRAFNQFTIACELDMINAISAADMAFIMSSSMSAWLLSPLECSPQKKNGWTLRFCFRGWIMWKMYNKTIIEFSHHSPSSFFHSLQTFRSNMVRRSRSQKIRLFCSLEEGWFGQPKYSTPP